MLDIKNLTFFYPRHKMPTISDISLSIGEGGIYGLLGSNGAGKSTLLYLICGLLTPKSGSVELFGTNTRLRRPATLADIFIVPEEFDLPACQFKKFINERAAFYPNFSYDDMARNLSTFSLDADMHLGELSMGQKKKAFMSFALAANTPLLLMDEPTNGLDIPGKASFRSFIASGMTDQRSIIISTHQVHDVNQLLDHVIIMNNCTILLNEPMIRISEHLKFLTTSDQELLAKALYALPSLQGAQAVLPNLDGEETEVNLETLFQFVTTQPNLAHQIFHLQ